MAKQKPQAPQKPVRAPTRRVAPPKQPQKGGTPVVLIIFLVFFVLISLVLGVFLYLAQDKIDTAKKEATTQQAEAKKWQEAESNYRKYIAPKMRSWWDTAGDAGDFRTLADMESEWNTNPSKPDPRTDFPWWAALRATMEGDPTKNDAESRNGWLGPYDAQAGKPARSMKELLDNFKKERDTLTKTFKEEQDKLVKKNKELEDYKKEYNRDVVDAEVKKVRAEYEKQIKLRKEEHEKTIAGLQQNVKDVERDTAKILADSNKAQKAEIAKKEEEVKDVKSQVERERAEIKKTVEKAQELAIDKIRARVLRADGGTENIYIDVGSNDRVQPGLKFSVRGVGPGGKPDREPKAMIEVISVVGPTVSLARITRVAKPEFARTGKDPVTQKPIDATSDLFWLSDPKQFWNSRNPILVGDVLFNPLWDPKEPSHVVLAGFFDLDNDGHDDLDFFRRYLTDVGVVVDGYLDPNNDNALKGKLDYQTDFLIVGGLPVLETGPTAQPLVDQVKQATGGPTGKAVAELNKQAVEKGVAVVRLKDYLARMGFSSLRLPNPRSSTAPANGAAAPAAEKKEEEKEKPKGGKKEEEEEAPKKKG